jgi:hypothetical protein
MRVKTRDKILFWAIALAIFLLGAASTLPPASRPTIAGPPQQSLIISEFVASNGTGLVDEDGDFPDWIELYNPTGQPLNLAGWSLTDDPTDPQKWPLPDLTLPSQDYLLIFASAKDRRANPPKALHTNFKLNHSGEFLGLYNILDNQFVEVLTPSFPPQQRDLAYGRYGDEQTFGYLAKPTPGQPNSSEGVWSGLVSAVEFSPARGFYDAPVSVELKTTTPGAVIRYTTNGSEPTETNGETYTDPLIIGQTTLLRAAAFRTGLLPSAATTHSYIFLDQVIEQPADPPGWPAAWGIYNAYYPGLPLKGSPVVADYQMDPRIVKDPRYRDTIKDDLKSIPSLSLVTAEKNFDIYAHAVERGEAWERPVSIELIDPNDPDRNFQINAGIRMQGVSNRWEFMPKKSFRLFFDSKYGPTKLQHPLFPDSPVAEFETLVLRGGANRSYAGYIDASVDHAKTTYAEDQWMRASQIAMSGIGSHGLYVHLYLNGLYWGLYNLVERPDASFTSAYLGGDREDWFAVKHGATVLNPAALAQGQKLEVIYREEISGSNERYEALLKLLEEGNFADPDRYALVKSYVDTAHFSDYIILNLYAGNRDWGDNNWYIGMQTKPAGPLKYFVWDAELVWDEGARLYLGKPTLHHKMQPLFLALLENPDFRIEFADRLYKNLFNDGPLTDANAQARWLEITEPISRAIVGESARWGDTRYRDNPIDRDDWLRARDGILAKMAGNGAKLLALTRQAGYYPLLDPPSFNQHGGQVRPGFELVMSLPAGQESSLVYYTTDGSDPRLPATGRLAPGAQLYNEPLVLTTTTPIKTRALTGDPASPTWSALNEAVFMMGEVQPRLHISELMYNPTGGSDYEFIELTNTGTVAFPLAGLSFEGITYTFPPAFKPLPPGRRFVLVHNAAAFAERYPDLPFAGVYTGRLANQGETISLKDSAGQVVVSVAYDDENGWPVSADGRGDSLTLAHPDGDPNDPKNWRASQQVNGSPGEEGE